VRIGFVGCGEISGAYLETLRQFPATEVVACVDLERALARAKAEAFAIPRTGSPEDVIGAGDVEVVLNLTPPLAHAEVASAALAAGKHVYGEKPLAVERPAGAALVRDADVRGFRVGCAPDTFLLGPIRCVAALARAGISERVVGKGPTAERRIPVETETHQAALVEHESGAIVTLTTSFDTPGQTRARSPSGGRRGRFGSPTRTASRASSRCGWGRPRASSGWRRDPGPPTPPAATGSPTSSPRTSSSTASSSPRST
jgi:predicted dehydrogenase